MPRELAQTSPVLELDLLSERQLADSCPDDRPGKGKEQKKGAGNQLPVTEPPAAFRAPANGQSAAVPYEPWRPTHSRRPPPSTVGLAPGRATRV